MENLGLFGNHKMNAREAAQEFASTYWDDRRKIRIWKDTGILSGEFSLVDGVRLYKIKFDPISDQYTVFA